MKEVIAKETTQLLEQQKSLFVCDLTSKFEKGIAAAAKLSDKATLRDVTCLEKHVLLKKLRDALELHRGSMVGKNMDDIDEVFSMVKALAIPLTQREGELIQENAKFKKNCKFSKASLY